MSNNLPYPVSPGNIIPGPYQGADNNNPGAPYPGAATQSFPGGQPYPPNSGQPYPPANSGYPPAPGLGYPSSQPYPPASGQPYPPASGQPYSAPPQSYPPSQQYPPPSGGGYPPPTQQYPPPSGGYPPPSQPYPAAPQGYPSPPQAYPSQPYPPAPPSQPYPPGPATYQTPVPSAPPAFDEGMEPFNPNVNVNLNEGPGKGFSSKLVNSALQQGMKMTKDALANKFPNVKNIPDFSKFTGGGQSPNDQLDGNCVSSPSSSSGLFSGGSHQHKFRSGEGSVKKWCGQDYKDLKRQCKSRGMLFEDPEFPASNHLLVDDNQQFVISYFGRTRFDSNSIQWKRPHEIISNPKMFVGDADRFDINQGEIGNCWFLAAVANLAENKKCFNRVVPQDQDFTDRDYQGMFRFRFWRFGEWVEVVIDDRLPTRNGKLIYLRSVEKNEFWGALLEKAYAKLHGSYRALEGGLTIEAAVDFTGGIPEMIDLESCNYSRERLFYIMSKADANGAFMGCALTSDSRRARAAQDLGLQSRHAYTITKVVEIRSHKVASGIPLVRLRNPHGNNREWRGDWSDGDKHWQMIPKHKQSDLGLNFDDDGEFYMSFRDFLKYFGELEICHLTPDSLEDTDNSRKKFEVFHFYGEWKAGSTSGGCGNDGNRAFSLNPQFFINLNDPDPYDDVTSCPVIISLMQRQKKRKTEHAVGFKIFKVDLATKSLDERALSFNKSIDRTDTFVNLREVSKRILLPEGRYCVIPCTFKQGEEGQFLVRVFVEKLWGSSECGRGHQVNDAMDAGTQKRSYFDDADGSGGAKGLADGIRNITIERPDKKIGGFGGFKKHNKITGFALKQLEKQFPKSMKGLKNFYNWTTNADEEFTLLAKIMKSF